MKALHDLYAARKDATSDINEHLPYLRELATTCTHITEFGVRNGNSTVALADGLAVPMEAGQPVRLVSYDINPPAIVLPFPEWRFCQADTSKLGEIEETDLLFIDTLHDCAQVRAELKHAAKVRRWLVFHDTVLFGTRDESTGEPIGINQAIWEFLANNAFAWYVARHSSNNCGLLTLGRRM